MQNQIQIECPGCGLKTIEVPFTDGAKKELIEKIEFLEQKLFEISEENMNLRKIIGELK